MSQLFGKNSKGEEVYIYTLKNESGMMVRFLNLGATVHELFVPGKDGQSVQVSAIYDDPLSYERETTYFGAIVAPYANRISDAKFEIDGQIYETDANNNENSLHSGINGIAKKIWTVKEQTENKIVFTYDAKDLEQGFPGNIHYEVTYEVTEKNELSISYYALSDKKTTINMTNHTYFNLAGALSGSVEGQELWIKASHYTPVKDAKAIPTGDIAPVDGTPFDFREAKAIGRDIRQDFDQLVYGQGYDHNFAIDKASVGFEKIATAYAQETGIQMDVWTDCIGVQLYTGNFMAGQKGPNEHTYVKHGAFCLETQYFPNAINETNFVCPITEANVPYETRTVYAFSVR
ncbi:MAG: galactose mutarotase [Agathobacter sp.]|nr:galactose mutarotase [Agathobacter sp.]